jgi:hypothetical protein
VSEPFPRVIVTRRFVDDGSRYFGPYTDVGAMRRALNVVKRVSTACDGNLAIQLTLSLPSAEGPPSGVFARLRRDDSLEVLEVPFDLQAPAGFNLAADNALVPNVPSGRYKLTVFVIFDLDEGTLQAISKSTGGEFYRAMDTGTIETAFASIDKARKIEFQAKSQLLTREIFHWFAGAGALLIALGGIGARRPAWPFGNGAPKTAADSRTGKEAVA